MDQWNIKYQNKMIRFINHLKSSYNSIQFIDLKSNITVEWIENMIDLKNSIGTISPPYQSDQLIVTTQRVPKLHDVSEYPLLYIVIRHIYPKVKTQKYFNTIHNIDDFAHFVEWYRINHIHLSFNQLLDQIDHSNELHHLFAIMERGTTPLKILYDVCYDNRFIGLTTIHEFESFDKLYYEINFDGALLKVFFNHDQTNEEIMQIISKIIYIMKFIKAYVNQIPHKKNKKNIVLNVIVLLSREKKKLPTKTQILCPNNVNSGMSMTGKIVYCWRYEEMQKVLIHEMVHFYGLDFNESTSNYNLVMDPIIKDMIRYVGIDHSNEAYTEFIAVVLNTILISNTIVEFVEKINIEFYHMLIQISKIINHFCDTTKCNLFDITILQNTSVRSYYILKCMLIFNIERMIEFIAHNDMRNNDMRNNDMRNNDMRNNDMRNNDMRNNDMRNNDMRNNAKIKKYAEIMIDSYKKFINNNDICSALKYISNYLNELRDKQWIHLNMRMTVFG